MVGPVGPAIIVVVGTAVIRPATSRVVSRVTGPLGVVGGAAVSAGGARTLPVSMRRATAVGVGGGRGSRPFLVRRGVAVVASSGRALPVGVRLAAAVGVSPGGGVRPRRMVRGAAVVVGVR